MEDRNEQHNAVRRQIRSVLEGNKEHYAFIVKLYKDKVYALLRGMGASAADAQDLTQETFIKAYRKLASHDPDKSFPSWLYAIAANLFKDFYKRKRWPECELDLNQPAPVDGPEEQWLLTEQRSEIHRRLGQLPANYRMVLLLRYTNDLTYEEIAESLGIPVSKVQNDLYRAKKSLQRRMAAEKVNMR
ncbi:RNA polymerase sigma factor [Paenibacillus rigui]|uniref:RNA polymerase sigma factor n=1 Tax=Paenibacillus rigui TaxID=554312 RepID=UPI001FE5580C|nr:sigma-70 family RNA polymerase sigma factor [Paenibacillus rigui]